MDIVLTFFGRFHPLLVHLPIGFILMGLLFECYKKKIQPATSDQKIKCAVLSSQKILATNRPFLFTTQKIPGEKK